MYVFIYLQVRHCIWKTTVGTYYFLNHTLLHSSLSLLLSFFLHSFIPSFYFHSSLHPSTSSLSPSFLHPPVFFLHPVIPLAIPAFMLASLQPSPSLRLSIPMSFSPFVAACGSANILLPLQEAAVSHLQELPFTRQKTSAQCLQFTPRPVSSTEH